VAVQSHFFSVGSVVSWAEPGVGAVATQSLVEPAFGPGGLDLMREGKSAPAALQQLIEADDGEAVRQVALVDGGGRVAVHTGMRCIAHAGHALGEQASAQANMMERETVPRAMIRVYSEASGRPLAKRLLAALEAAEAEGGDVRGRQSAALLVVPPEGEAWRARVDLRVEDHADPLAELARLLGLWRAYELAGAADELMAAERADEAGALYRRAAELAPDSDELLFWAGLAMAHAGDLDDGVAAVRSAAEAKPNWLVLLDRLSGDFAPAGAAVRAALGRD
jgi:uncharacterized Ntn-hydrolase superfamily protein